MSETKEEKRRKKILKSAVVGIIAAVLATVAIFRFTEIGKEAPVTESLVEATAETAVEATPETVQPLGEPEWDPPDFSGRTFTIWGLEYDPHVEAYERLAKMFEGYTGAKATIEPQSWPIEDNIITGMAADLVPDVCCIMGRQITPLVYQDALVDLTDVVYSDVPQGWFSPVSIGAYQYDDKTWGVPTEGNCTSGVTNVRLDFLEEAGAGDMWPPNQGKDGFDSFEEMWALAEALQVEEDGKVTRWGMSSQGWYANQLFGVMRTLGQDWWDPETRTFHLDSPEALEAITLLNYETIYELGIESHMDVHAQELMNEGRVAICNGNVTGPSSGEELGLRIDTCTFPSAVPGKEALYVGEGGWGFVVPSQAKNIDIGIEFMKFLTTYEGNKTYCEIYGGIVSAVPAVNGDDDLFPKGTLVGDAMRRASGAQKRTVYYGTGYGTPGEAANIVGAIVEAVRVGEMAPEEALAEAQAQLEEMLARWDADHR